MSLKINKSVKIILLFFCIALITVFAIFMIFVFTHIIPLNENRKSLNTTINSQNEKKYHIIVTSTYENQFFMQQVFDGANRIANEYDFIVELYVPDSLAENTNLQTMLDYCSYVNVDGIIAYIDSPEQKINVLQNINKKEIPLVTTGQFSQDIPQISFIGNSYWELGKKFADESIKMLGQRGNIFVLNDNSKITTFYSNLLNSFQNTLSKFPKINVNVIQSIDKSIKLNSENNLFVCFTEEDTINSAQTLFDLFNKKDYQLIGFGNNEVCTFYLQKNYVDELLSVNPGKIGENAIINLSEYLKTGYTNNYITTEVRITRNYQ